MLAEQPLQLPLRHPRQPREFFARQRLLNVVLHQRYHFEQRLVRRAQARDQRHALLRAGIADMLHDELFRNLRDLRRAHARSDQVQHHVERRDAAGTGHTIPVDHKKLFEKARFREFFF